MDRESLKALLDAEDVDPAAYSLDGGLPFEAYVLERRPCDWVVYYSQRGMRSSEEAFEVEGDACARLLELILRDSTTRRSQ